MTTATKMDLDYRLTDSGNADRLIAEHGEDFRYCGSLGGWLHWTGTRWTVDNAAIWERAKHVGKALQHEAAENDDRDDGNRIWKHSRYTLSQPGLKRMIELAQKDSHVIVGADLFDSDPYLLNVLNGTLDLRTGEMKDHCRDDLITKLASMAYDPNAKAPVWDAFLSKIFPDYELREYVQMAIGYGATGDVSEQAFFILYGIGRNGKSTFVEAIRNVLGNYASKTNSEMLMQNRNGGGATPNVADLKGSRFVYASESDEGQKLAAGLIKDLTSGETVNGRYLYKNPIKFFPTHKLFLSTNHLPEIDGNDPAMWRRIHQIPFNVIISKDEMDKHLPEKLRSEVSGILNWIVRGAMMWHQSERGLEQPEAVVKATDEYHESMDRIGIFISEKCVTGSEGYVVSKADLYNSYKSWCEACGICALGMLKFNERLKKRNGVEEKRIGKHGTKGWKGIGLRTAYPHREPLFAG